MSLAVFLLLVLAMSAQADIFQWEYINPADPGQGKRQSTTLVPDGAGAFVVPGTNLTGRNLTMAYLIGADLSATYSCFDWCYLAQRSDLSGANLSDADLATANLSSADLSGANFRGANLTSSNLWGTILTDADFSQTTLINASLHYATLTGADFTGALVQGADFGYATGFTAAQLYSTVNYQAHDLSGIKIDNIDLSGWNFAEQNLTHSNFEYATLSGASFVNANLAEVNLKFATLSGADFTGAEVRGTNFSSTTARGFTAAQLYSTASYQSKDLTGIDLTFNNLNGANFAGQNLTDVNFSQAALTGADFTGANIRGANFQSESYTEATGLTLDQLYSTASYQAHDLSRANFANNDLSGGDFAGQNLAEASFYGATLARADFRDANVRGANFNKYWANRFSGISLGQLYSTASAQAGDLSGVQLQLNDLSVANFAGYNLTDADFSFATLSDASFRQANLNNANFSYARLMRADFTGANMAGAKIGWAYFSSTTSRGLTAAQFYSTASYQARDLQGIQLDSNDLSGWNFAGQNLANANFEFATLSDANFNGAVVSQANFGRNSAPGGGTGITPAQLYSTASYQSRDLSRISFSNNDLSGGDFNGQNLSSANLSGADLSQADLTNAYVDFATLTGADLRQADLTNVSFQGATLTGADFTDAEVQGVNFEVNFNINYYPSGTGISAAQLYSTASYQARNLSGINLTANNLAGANFVGQNFTDVRFHLADLTGADFSEANLANANFGIRNVGYGPEAGAILTGAILTEANLSNANLAGATLTNANFTGAEIRGATFGILLAYGGFGPFGTGITPSQLYSTASYRAHDLTGIHWHNLDLSDCNFVGQNLTNANFSNTNLAGTNLSQANLTNAVFTGATFTGADFTNAVLRGTRLSSVTSVGFTAGQLYSTASYQSRDLSGIQLWYNDLHGWSFAGQNLANADFYGADLTGADFAGAKIQGARFSAGDRCDLSGCSRVGGLSPAQLYSTASYQSRDLTGIILSGNDLSHWNFADQNLTSADLSWGTTLYGADLTHANLTNANLGNSTLMDADLTGAVVRGANFSSTTSKGFTSAQLYSSASYQAHDLAGIVLTSNGLSGWNFAGQNLTDSAFGRADSGSYGATLVGADFSDANLSGANFGGANLSGANFRHANLANANFQHFAGYSGSGPFGCGRGFPWCTPVYVSATLSDADLTAADARGTTGFAYPDATNTNLILPDGHIRGLDLEDCGLLQVRDYDGDSRIEPARPPIPITVDEHLAMGPDGTLRMVFEADAWDSTISFAPGIPVTLGGTLELIFVADVNPATQVGRAFDLFDWTGVDPTGAFAISSPYSWDLSNLYTTGEVTLIAIPEPATIGLAALGLLGLVVRVRSRQPEKRTGGDSGNRGCCPRMRADQHRYPRNRGPKYLRPSAKSVDQCPFPSSAACATSCSKSNSPATQATLIRRRRALYLTVAMFPLLAFAARARADIYQWEYIDPADPGQGKRQSTTLAAGVDAAPGAYLGGRDLTKAYLIGSDMHEANLATFVIYRPPPSYFPDPYYTLLTSADLSHANLRKANFTGAILTDANFAGADIQAARFSKLSSLYGFYGTGLTPAQLYTTASYQARDLRGVAFDFNSLAGVDLASQNLVDASFFCATLTNAELTGADVREANFAQNSFRDEAGITPVQLYSTASYLAHDLSGITLDRTNLAGGNFAGQNLTNASFVDAAIAGADFTGAQVTGARFDSNFGNGVSLVQLYSTLSYQAKNLTGISLAGNDLSGGNFAEQNLTNANFLDATLTDANFTDALVQGANFSLSTGSPPGGETGAASGADYGVAVNQLITEAQLYSTASYQARNLMEIGLVNGNLSGWNFSGQNLTGAKFGGANLTGANFREASLSNANFLYYVCNRGLCSYGPATLTNVDLTAADVRGASSFELSDFSGATIGNLIRPDGHIDGLDLNDGSLLVVRDYDGDPRTVDHYGNPTNPISPIPITIDQHLTMGPGSTLRMVFEADAWDSTISFAPGIPVALGGKLELTFAPDVNLASQLGRTFKLFDGTGVNPTGAFSVSSPYAWNLANLYSTGEVTLTAIPEPTSVALVVMGLIEVVLHVRRPPSKIAVSSRSNEESLAVAQRRGGVSIKHASLRDLCACA